MLTGNIGGILVIWGFTGNLGFTGICVNLRYFRVVSKKYISSGSPFFIWWGAHSNGMRAPGMRFGGSLECIFY